MDTTHWSWPFNCLEGSGGVAAHSPVLTHTCNSSRSPPTTKELSPQKQAQMYPAGAGAGFSIVRISGESQPSTLRSRALSASLLSSSSGSSKSSAYSSRCRVPHANLQSDTPPSAPHVASVSLEKANPLTASSISAKSSSLLFRSRSGRTWGKTFTELPWCPWKTWHRPKASPAAIIESSALKATQWSLSGRSFRNNSFACDALLSSFVRSSTYSELPTPTAARVPSPLSATQVGGGASRELVWGGRSVTGSGSAR